MSDEAAGGGSLRRCQRCRMGLKPAEADQGPIGIGGKGAWAASCGPSVGWPGPRKHELSRPDRHFSGLDMFPRLRMLFFARLARHSDNPSQATCVLALGTSICSLVIKALLAMYVVRQVRHVTRSTQVTRTVPVGAGLFRSSSSLSRIY